MLVVEKDNIVIDVQKRRSQDENSGWLVFEATLHINGKLKRTSFDVRVTKERSQGIPVVTSSGGYCLVDWNDIYGPLQTLQNLGYDIGKSTNEVVEESLNHHYGIINNEYFNQNVQTN